MLFFLDVPLPIHYLWELSRPVPGPLGMFPTRNIPVSRFEIPSQKGLFFHGVPLRGGYGGDAAAAAAAGRVAERAPADRAPGARVALPRKARRLGTFPTTGSFPSRSILESLSRFTPLTRSAASPILRPVDSLRGAGAGVVPAPHALPARAESLGTYP